MISITTKILRWISSVLSPFQKDCLPYHFRAPSPAGRQGHSHCLSEAALRLQPIDLAILALAQPADEMMTSYRSVALLDTELCLRWEMRKIQFKVKVMDVGSKLPESINLIAL